MRAGLDIIAAVARTRDAPRRIAVRIGIATGVVVIGDQPRRVRCGSTPWSGTRRTFAARLQAWPSQDDRRRRLHAGCSAICFICVTSVGMDQGYCRPVAAWAVEAYPSEPFRGGPRDGSGPLSSAARTRSISCWNANACLEGEGQVVLISGRAGDRPVPPCGSSGRAHRQRAA